MQHLRLRLVHAVAPIALLAAAPAIAQDAGPDDAIAEIVVTAQRRAQNLQDVPLSVTALDARAITEAGFTNSLSIGDQVPNLEIKTFGGVPNLAIRGVGNNDFNSSSIGPVSIYRDDVVVASTGSQIFALMDLDRIEVLRGPQGTLFGKNTTGGAIQYFSTLPADVMEGKARFGYGRFNLFEAETGVSIPLAEDFGVRVAGLVRRRDGERVNLFNGGKAIDIDEAAARVILRYHPGDIDARLSIGGGRDRSDYLENKPVGTMGGANLFGYRDPLPDNIRFLNFNGPSRNDSDNFFATLNVAYVFGDFTLKSITGYDKSSIDNRVDVDGSPVRIDEIKFLTDTRQLTQELQLSYAGERLDWIIGAFVFDENFNSRSEADLLGEVPTIAIPLVTEATRDNTSYAVFGQGTYELTERARITLGGRYTIDKVGITHREYLIPGLFDANIPDGPEIAFLPLKRDRDTWKAFSWRAALDFDVTEDVLAYASINRGFKAGGYNIGIVFSEAERTKVDPEYLTSYEVGVKATLFDRRLRFNSSAFYYDYTKLQVLAVSQQGNGLPALILDNAADATIKGLEVEILAIPARGLDLGLNFGVLDAKYKNYTSAAIDPVTGGSRDFSGNRLPGAPRFSGSASVQYEFPVGAGHWARLRAEYNYTGKKFYNNAEDDLISSGDRYGLVNLRAALGPDSREWELAAWVRNVGDKAYIIDATDLRDFGFVPRYYGERRTYGVELTVRFGS
ncbi:MAG: TonB-dependent receptor [Phenylobacterium sp.]|uniref:TonB-dependent receptor n=1 Tax=Phenylobacterium sp. TaxID=1871053 RepID=UPI0027350F1D|nr:TonB-dependent receptor [Phenylobacterium sp.]MDP3746485.1 TonB-dependent receptor [Phenylobacterium sp.]